MCFYKIFVCRIATNCTCLHLKIIFWTNIVPFLNWWTRRCCRVLWISGKNSQRPKHINAAMFFSSFNQSFKWYSLAVPAQIKANTWSKSNEMYSVKNELNVVWPWQLWSVTHKRGSWGSSLQQKFPIMTSYLALSSSSNLKMRKLYDLGNFKNNCLWVHLIKEPS